MNTALLADFKGPLAWLASKPPSIDMRVHSLYNPEAITQYNIVPGLIGVVLMMTLVLITGLAITRESERGTMENLLSMPLRPTEVLIGKITPYILVGYIQVATILVAARYMFNVPIQGDLGLLLIASFFFIAANLAMGITFSTIAKNQLQAMQMSAFIFLPSILLSGFLFPFRGMPGGTYREYSVGSRRTPSAPPQNHQILAPLAAGVGRNGSGFFDDLEIPRKKLLHDLGWALKWRRVGFRVVGVSIKNSNQQPACPQGGSSLAGIVGAPCRMDRAETSVLNQGVKFP